LFPLFNSSFFLDLTTTITTTKSENSEYKLKTIPFGGHSVALGPAYTGTDIKKYPIKRGCVSWSIPYVEYKPVEYTAPVVLKHLQWADPELR